MTARSSRPKPGWPICWRLVVVSVALSIVPFVAVREAAAACGTYPLPATGANIPAFSSVDNYVQTWVAANNVNAATLAITYDKTLVYEHGYGYQDSACTQQILPDARMRLATNSTAMTRRGLQQLIADGELTATTNVQQYLNRFFTLPPSSERRLQQIRVRDIYNFLTCTSDASYIDNNTVGANMGLGRPATATERIQYMWAHPQYLMPASTAGCTPGFANNNGFSHVSHEIAAAVIAAGYYHLNGRSGYNDPSLTSSTGVGSWYGQYMQWVVGRHVGATLYQSDDGYPGSVGPNPLPNEIWYDSVGATACPEWNYWACAINKPQTQQQVPAAYAIDFYARPGSGTITASARDVARFMVSYEWATDNSVLTNSIYQLSHRSGPGKPWGCCDGGSLPGTTSLMGDGPIGGQTVGPDGQYHFWNWVLLVNRNGVPAFDISSLLDNGSTGIFNTYAFPFQADQFAETLILNRWINQYAWDDNGAVSYAPLAYGDFPLYPYANPYFPYNTLPHQPYLWRARPDANGYYQITNEWTSNMMSNEHGAFYLETLPPNNNWWSEEWYMWSPDPGWWQILSRWNGNGVHVQDQDGWVEQGPVQSGWWSADWQLTASPSGLCCNNLTSTTNCPAGGTACLCRQSGCPAYTP